MDYKEAATKLLALVGEMEHDADVAAAALETAGAIHTEALLASLEAFNRAALLVKSAHDDNQEKKFTTSGAELQPMPGNTAELRLDFPLTAEQFTLLQTGEAPADDFNRWFLESDGMHLRYYRNATGYCFFDAEVEPADEGFVVGTVIVNQDDKQYTETNMGVCAAQMKILLANNLGLDDDPYWDEMDAAADAEE